MKQLMKIAINSFVTILLQSKILLEWGQSMDGPIANIHSSIENALHYILLTLTFVSNVIPLIQIFCCHLQIVDNQCPNYEPLTSRKVSVTKKVRVQRSGIDTIKYHT